MEDYVKAASPELYKQLEDAMSPVGLELLRSDTTTVEKVTPLLKQDKYNSVITAVEKQG